MRTSLDHHQARTLFERILFPKLSYSNAATRFTAKECNQIMAPVRSIAIARMGFNRSSAHAVLFGPKEFGGYGLPHFETSFSNFLIPKKQQHMWAEVYNAAVEVSTSL